MLYLCGGNKKSSLTENPSPWTKTEQKEAVERVKKENKKK